jgi:hypothetical protein
MCPLFEQPGRVVATHQRNEDDSTETVDMPGLRQGERMELLPRRMRPIFTTGMRDSVISQERIDALNARLTPEDIAAVASDWQAVGDDMRRAIDDVTEQEPVKADGTIIGFVAKSGTDWVAFRPWKNGGGSRYTTPDGKEKAIAWLINRARKRG